jgi:hypothetical protein
MFLLSGNVKCSKVRKEKKGFMQGEDEIITSGISCHMRTYLLIKVRKISSHHISEDIFQYSGMPTFLKSSKNKTV